MRRLVSSLFARRVLCPSIHPRPLRAPSHLRTVAAFLASALALTACAATSATAPPGKTSTSTSPSKRTAAPVTVGVAFLPNLSGASSLAVAIDQGYFARAGIKVHAVEFQSGPTEIAAMQAGNVQFVSIGPGIMYLPMKGLSKYLFSDNVGLADSVLGNKADGITTAAELKNQKVLVPLGSTGEIVLLETLHRAGLSLSAVHLVNASPSEQVSGFLSNSAPALAGWIPNTTEVLKKDSNAVTLGSDSEFYPTVQLPSNWSVDSAYAASHPAVVTRFVAAMLRAATYRTDHLGTAVRETAQLTHVPATLLAAGDQQTHWFTEKQIMLNYSTGKERAWMQKLNTFYIQEGLLPNKVPFARYSLAGTVTAAAKVATGL